MTILSGRNYDVLVAQRADPWREIQTPDDAAWALRQSCQSVRLPYPGDVDTAFIEFARESMVRDIRDGLRRGCAEPGREITHEQYWRSIAQLAAASKRPNADLADMAEKHPFTGAEHWSADVHRHTAQPLAMDDPALYWARDAGDEDSVMQFLRDSARASIYADAWHEANSMVPYYRPNELVHMDHDALLKSGWKRASCDPSAVARIRSAMKRGGIRGVYICYWHPRFEDNIVRVYDWDTGDLVLEGRGEPEQALSELELAAFRRMVPNRTCKTRLRGNPYPCQLRRLDDFEDVSYGNDENDSVRFRIGARWYWLFIGPDDEQQSEEQDRDFPRFALNSDDDPDEAYQAGSELETDDEPELMRYLGDLVVRARKSALGLSASRRRPR